MTSDGCANAEVPATSRLASRSSFHHNQSFIRRYTISSCILKVLVSTCVFWDERGEDSDN